MGYYLPRILHCVATLWVALFLFAPTTGVAEVFRPAMRSRYVCVQKASSSVNLVGAIKLRHKNKKTKIVGRKTWTYGAMVSRIAKLERSSSKKKRKEARRIAKALEVLLSCYDARDLPRPGEPAPTEPTPSPEASFADVQPIIQANCMGCHTARGWTNSQEYFLQSRLVSAGNPDSSDLYKSLRGNPQGLTPASMPATGETLAQADIALIHNWIANLSPEVTPPDPVGQFGCVPTVQVGTSRMKRLSKVQLRNSLRDLAMVGLAGSQSLAEYYTWNSASRATKFIPDDYSKSGHHRLDDRLDQTYLEGVLRVVENFADRLELDGRLRAFVQSYVPTCSQSNYLTTVCRDEFLRRFGRRALKGALSQSDFDFYRKPDSGGQSQASYRDIFVSLLSSPRFLYHLEAYGSPADSSELLLWISPSEYVARLSYAMWNTTPDDQLLQYAENGTVDSDPETVVAYVLDQQSEKSRAGLRELFDGWFDTARLMEEISQYFEVDLYGTGGLTNYLAHDYGLNELPLVESGLTPNETRSRLLGFRSGVRSELADIGTILTFVQPSPVSDLFTTRIAPVQDVTLSRNYNLSTPWDGNLESIPLAPESRGGVLTRTAFHLTRGARKRSILIGSLLREHLLCDPTGLPADNSPPIGLNLGSAEYRTGSTHHQVQTLTEQPDTTCIGCHQRWLNPLGIAMGDFDTLGRRRNGVEWVYEGYSNIPAQVYLRPYQTTSVPRLNRDDLSEVSGTVQLGQKFAESEEMHACFTRNLVRFVLARAENSGDGCFMNEMFDDVRSLPMKEVLRRYFVSAAFRSRRLNETFPN